MKGFPELDRSKPVNPGDYRLPEHLEYRDALRLHAGKILEDKGFGGWFRNEYKTNCLIPEDFERLLKKVKQACPYVGYNTILEDSLDFVYVVEARSMGDDAVLYSLEFNGRQLESVDVALENDVAAITLAFKMLSKAEYPPAHGRDMTDCCTIHVTYEGRKSFVCNVNSEGEVDFID